MSDNNAANHETAETSAVSTQLETALKELLSLGQVWASYGLNAGKHALETSARSQETLARLLGGLAEQLRSEKSDERAA